MRPTFVALLLAALLCGVVAAPQPAEALQPRFVDVDFLDGPPSGRGWSLWGWSSTRNGHDGPGLVSWINTGEHGAAGGHAYLRTLSGRRSIDQAWFRYWLRLDDDFYVAPPAQGKLPGLAGLNGTYRCLGGKPSTPSQPCWSARTVFSRVYPDFGQPGYPDGDGTRTLLGTYLYHLDVPERLRPYGEVVLWDEDVALLEHGRWYCVEGMVRMNTPGERDGIARAWVDGRLAMDRTDLRLRRDGEGSLGVQTLWMDLYHGGSVPSARDNEVRLDSLAVGAQRLGCSDGAQHDGAFSDDDLSTSQDAIEWMVAQGLTTGCDPRRPHLFCPTGTVTRSQVAQFLADGLALPDGDATFDDVRYPRAQRATAALARSGVTSGCAPRLFCPEGELTRAQFALMLDRLLDLPTDGPPPGDVDPYSPFAAAVSAVVAADLVPPCAADRFCPTSPATRELVAEVLHRVAAEGLAAP